jgi:hypothetical protein
MAESSVIELRQPLELFAHEHEVVRDIEGFIERQPETVGVFDGKLNQDGVYISPSVQGIEHRLPQAQAIELRPGLRLGAAASHHSVMFGDVSVRYPEGTDSIVKVAVKSFSGDGGWAEHEHDCYIAAAERGLDTFRPLALAKNGETTYLITEYRPNLHTLDNADWTISPSDIERYDVTVRPNLRFVSEGLADMHAKGVFSGDALAKNFAKTDTGKRVVLDLETAVIASDSQQRANYISGGGDIMQSEALRDVVHMWYALIHPMGEENEGNVFLAVEDFETCMRVFEHDFLNPYLTQLINALGVSENADSTINAEELKAAIMQKVAVTT